MTTTATPVQVALLVAGVLGLWAGARLLVDAVVRLARGVGLSDLTIGLTVVAAGTSTPELVVTTDAALQGLGDVAVGNVLGSNVYNLAFILGVVSLVRVLPVERALLHRDGLALVASTLVGAGALLDRTVTRLEGVALLGLFVLYTAYLLRSGGSRAAPALATDGDPATTVDTDTGAHGGARGGPFRSRLHARLDRVPDPLLAVAGLALVLVSGDLLVGAATELARGAGVSEWVIGNTVVAAGTSTPEFAVSLVALQSGRLGVSVGNVVGSNVFNVLGVLGLGAALRPLTVGGPLFGTLAWLLAVSVAVVAAMWTGRRLSRAEGGLLTLSEAGRWLLGLLG